MRELDFFDGLTSASAPTQGITTATALKVYADDAAFVTGKGAAAANGDAYYNSTINFIRIYADGSWRSVTTGDQSQTLTGKTINADANTISNIEDADIKVGAAIARAKLASGTNYRILANSGAGVMSENAALTAAHVVYVDANGQLVGEAKLSKSRGGVGYDLTTEALEVPEIATPATPASGFARFYAKSDGLPYWLDDAGVEISLVGASTAASQAEQEAASNTTKFVTPGRQQFHPSAAKGWVNINATTGVPVIDASYNVTSITDHGVGDGSVNHTTNLSSGNYAYAGISEHDSGTQATFICIDTDNPPTASSFRFTTLTNGAAAVDVRKASLVFYGDQ